MQFILEIVEQFADTLHIYEAELLSNESYVKAERYF